MKSMWIGILAVAGLGASAGAAQAGGVQWSIGVNLPPVTTVISGGPAYPAYYPAPVYAPPPRVVYAPPPVVYVPPPVVLRPVPRYVVPAPVVVYPGWGGHRGGYYGGYHGGYHGEHRHGGRDGYRDRRYRDDDDDRRRGWR